MKHILVPIGSTENAQNTLQYAIDFSSKIGAKVFVFRAYNIPSKAETMINITKFIENETKLYLRSVVKSVDRKNVEISIISSKRSVIDSIQNINKELKIDLVIIGTKSNSIKEEVFLGNTTGSIVKQTEIPVLIVPIGYTFKPFKHILMAIKSGKITKNNALHPLKNIITKFTAELDLLLVKTPNYSEDDLELNNELSTLKNSLTISENATTYQGVLEHFQSHNPDLLCVLRRKRGFFKKLWEKNTILKSEFFCTIPLLVLSGNK